ncbi:hypothetical protein BGZ61DRAFT_526648 [Ilyonectria robusta]|uniref:uncharacterized protein n=1 Tax=Ilyonectria robusta TaxID=1079257 RepID=UPI001E8DDDA6|nr:uncharacterized protein BGZ61DRAFT_526648 [Ilyonectria robusta]KAH8735587.1 hypothetical protein BGZ61DRAFT_526648 [Ilyonectria robusta]
MTAQLLPDVLGLAVGVLIYSIFSLSLGLLTAWLVWVHREGTSYVFLLAIFTVVGGVASIAQQIHTIVDWRDIKLEQHRHTVANVGNPVVALASGSVDLDLALFYIQFTCYGIEALLIFFWCAVLLQSVFQLRILENSLRYSNAVAKASAIFFPVLMVCLLQIKALQNNTIGFFVIANLCMSVGLLGGAIMLLSILGRYIYTRRALISFQFKYGKSSTRSGAQSRASTAGGVQARQKIYDRWLILRLAIGFVALGIFQLVTIMTEVVAQAKNNRSHLSDSADLSLAQARSDFTLFLPGATPPLVTFVVFGTTRPFRQYMWAHFVPGCFKRREDPQTPKNLHGTDHTQSSRTHEVYVYSPNNNDGHDGASSSGSAMMLSDLAHGRIDDDAVPILEGSTPEDVGGRGPRAV